MPNDSWDRLQYLYHAALRQPPEERAGFLAQACPDDPQLRLEVQSLLQQAVDSFLESAPAAPAPVASPGTRLGNFEIVGLLGRGGMGEVYRARDVRLKREVAIKVLPAGLARDPDRVARFEREARAASALNHPNIVAVYDIGQDGGVYWIATELVTGESLASTIQRGPLPSRKAVEIATQVADGLAAAHAAGIVHRDLKPANIMLARDDRVKILDFGLAKQQSTNAETATLDLTDEGAVMGTAGYMSPEQVRGVAVDQRSDLFSFGVVLYEMLGGKRAFSGTSSVEIMHAILKEEPAELPATVPEGLIRIVRRSLEKDPARRFHSAADLAFALRSPSDAPPKPWWPGRAWPKRAIGAAAATVIAGVILFWLLRPRPLPRVIRVVQITQDNRAKEDAQPALLTDDSRLFFWSSDNEPDYQVSVRGGESAPLILQMKQPAYLLDVSPDRTDFLVCRFLRYSACELWVEPMIGGAPHRLGNLVVHHDAVAWSPDGQQLAYAHDHELHLASRDGTEIRKLASMATDPVFLSWSPIGGAICFSASSGTGKHRRLWEVRNDGTGLHEKLPGWNPSWNMQEGRWTPGGKYFVYSANQKIWIVRERKDLLDLGSHDPVELNIGQLVPQHLLPSADGKRLFFEGFQDRREFLRYDRKSGQFALELPGVSGTQLSYSKDGKWVAYISIPGNVLYRSAADGSQRLQLSSASVSASMPHWSPDGRQIAFTASPGKSLDRVYVVPFEGGEPGQVSHGEAGKNGDWTPSWSPDGASLAFGSTVWDRPSEQFIQILDLKTNRVSSLPGSQGIWSPEWSPDGRYIAGRAGTEWKLVVYDVRSQTQSVLFSQAAGSPNWSPDGAFLFASSDEGWWRVRIRDRKVELVKSLQNIPLADWGWFAVAPNDSLIAARDTGTREVYALDWDLP